MITFSQPHWLVIGLLACIGLAFAFRQMQKKRQATLEKFAAHQLISKLTRNISKGRRRNKNILVLLAVFLCFSALARPQYGFKWVDVKRKGIDLLFALDTSKSMLAEDIKPNRLKRAHLAILDFVQQLEGDRVGLMPFAGSAYLMCPLTLDYEAFSDSLAAITTDIIPRGGTNISSVIEMAVQTLNNEANHKILIILTDGENLEGDAVLAAEKAAKDGLTIYTVGVGTSQGELIPVTGKNGQGFIKDQQGNFVTSKLDEAALTAIAEKSSGLYVPLGAAGEGLETIYQQKLSLVPKEELAERRHKVPIERFEWPLIAALFLLIFEGLIGERRKSHALPSFNTLIHKIRKHKKLTKVTALLLLVTFGSGTKAYSSKGEEAFVQQDYLAASEYYSQQLNKSPNNPELLYNYGTSAYKNNMFDEAIEAFTGALKSDDIELQKKAYYNRGNSYYQKGLESQQADPNTTVDQWHQALQSLESAMKLAPEDADAKHNHTFITKRLEELEKQQQKQQDQKDQQDQKQDGDSDKQDQGSQQEKDQSQNPKNQQQADNNQSTDTKQDQKQQAKPQNKPEEQSKQNPDDKTEKKAAPINESAGKNDGTEQQEKQDAQRQQLGKMTKEEAESLLNALKNEEGELNFVPTDSTNNERNIDKDW